MRVNIYGYAIDVVAIPEGYFWDDRPTLIKKIIAVGCGGRFISDDFAEGYIFSSPEGRNHFLFLIGESFDYYRCDYYGGIPW